MQTKKHYFVIVNYNSGSNIIDCINSILMSKNIHPHIIIVDNASRDNSLEECKIQFSNVTYIYNTHNIGFGAGANIGARFALERNAATITFCNPDAIIAKTCAHTIISAITSHEADIISPIIYKDRSSHIWFSGGRISFFRMRTTHTQILSQTAQELINTDYITGCVMTVSAQVFKKIGLFDEHFFLYYEDADFSVRARNAGYILKVASQAKAWHKEVSEEEKEQKTYFLVLSGLLFFDKHSHGIQRLWFNIHFMLRKIKNYFQCKHNPLAQYVHKAYLDYAKKK